MNVGLYQAASAMNANARWQEAISDNLANASVAGARKTNVSFSAVAAGQAANVGGERMGQFVMPTAHTHINFQPAPLRPTGAPLDLGIEGRGFFEVQLPNGATAYTRDGEFHLNAQGQLVTKQGYTVLSDSGPVQLDPNDGWPVSVSPTGEVCQGSDIKGKLRVVDFEDPGKLTMIGHGCFLADKPGVIATEVNEPGIYQGYLETSNTSPTSEMASLITAMRMFEANQRVMQLQDERMGRVISELGNPA